MQATELPPGKRSPTLRVRTDRLHRYRTANGLHSNYALAKAMGVKDSTVSRVLSTRLRNPGQGFVLGLLRAFPDAKFEDLFEVTS